MPLRGGGDLGGVNAPLRGASLPATGATGDISALRHDGRRDAAAVRSAASRSMDREYCPPGASAKTDSPGRLATATGACGVLGPDGVDCAPCALQALPLPR